MINEKVILGKGCVYSTDPEKTGINNNIIVCGGSGSGKTMSISEPRLLNTKETSLIATVTKRRIVNEYRPLFEKRGYRVWDLNFADPQKGNIGYDPLSYLKEEKDIAFLAHSLVCADPRKGKSDADPFWDQTAQSLLCAEIAYILATKENGTFTDVLRLHDRLDFKDSPGRWRSGGFATTLDGEFKELKESVFGKDETDSFPWDSYERGTDGYTGETYLFDEEDEDEDEAGMLPSGSASTDSGPGSGKDTCSCCLEGKREIAEFALKCWKSFSAAADKTGRSILVSLSAVLDTVFDRQIREMMDLDRKVDFRELAKGRTVLFVTTSPVNTSVNYFINVFYADAIKALFEYAQEMPGGRLPVPVHILCDDFAGGGRIPNFAGYISIFREAGVSVTLLLQSESQLAGMYGENDAVTIINNCDTYIYMGGMDYRTAQNVSIRLDVPVTDVLNMPVGREVVIRRGQEPVKTERYDIRENELYREVISEYAKTGAFAREGR